MAGARHVEAAMAATAAAAGAATHVVSATAAPPLQRRRTYLAGKLVLSTPASQSDCMWWGAHCSGVRVRGVRGRSHHDSWLLTPVAP